ncbi:MAG: glycosyltransferase family 2 protein [Candidatus Jordarchaeaceae archaeon]
MNTKILVIIPCFNRPKALELCLRSLKNQQVKEMDVVVVDDCSAELYASQIRDLTSKFSEFVYYIRSNRRLGLPGARNLGLSKRDDHELVLFLDDDCIVDKNGLSNLIKINNKTFNMSIKAFVPRLIPSRDMYLHAKYSVATFGKLSKEVYCNFNQNTGIETLIPYGHACSCFRSEIFDMLLFDSESYKGNFLREETDFFLRMSKAGWRALFCPSVIIYHRNFYSGSGCRINKFYNELATIRNHLIFVARHFPLYTFISVPFFMFVRIAKILAFTTPFMQNFREIIGSIEL